MLKPSITQFRRPWTFGIAVAVQVLMIVLLIWHPTFTLTIGSADIIDRAGYAYIVKVSPWLGYQLIPDSNESPRISNLVVLEKGKPLGPAHATHEEIIKVGNGAFSHWLDVVYFSTPGNADPLTAGVRYEIRATQTLRPVFFTSFCSLRGFWQFPWRLALARG